MDFRASLSLDHQYGTFYLLKYAKFHLLWTVVEFSRTSETPSPSHSELCTWCLGEALKICYTSVLLHYITVLLHHSSVTLHYYSVTLHCCNRYMYLAHLVFKYRLYGTGSYEISCLLVAVYEFVEWHSTH